MHKMIIIYDEYRSFYKIQKDGIYQTYSGVEGNCVSTPKTSLVIPNSLHNAVRHNSPMLPQAKYE